MSSGPTRHEVPGRPDPTPRPGTRPEYPFALQIVDCWIGHFDVPSTMIRTLIINRGDVLSIATPPSSEKASIYGNAEIKSVFIPKADGMYRGNKYGSAPWTNMRHHLISSGNLVEAGMFHTAALSIERKSRRWYDIHRWIGAVYEYGGEYGSSIAKPFAFLGASWILGALMYYIGDGTAVAPNVTWKIGVRYSKKTDPSGELCI